MDCIVQGVAKSWTQLSDFHFHVILFHPSLIAGYIEYFQFLFTFISIAKS